MDNYYIENQLLELLKHLPQGVLWLEESPASGAERNLIIRYSNEAARRLLQLGPDGGVGDLLLQDRLIGDPAIQAQLVAEPSVQTEWHQAATAQWLRLEKQPLASGYVLLLTDMTATKTQAGQREALIQKLQQAIDTAQTGTFYTAPVRDAGGQIVDWVFLTANQTIAALVQLAPEELIGERGSKWFPAYLTNGLFAIYVDVFETGETRRFEYHYYEENKIDAWFDFMVSKAGNELLITLADVTPLKRMHLQLEEYVYLLKRSNESLEQFAFAASHDLQVPLRSISLNIDRLEAEYGSLLDDTGYKYVERVQSVVKRMRRLIQDLLVFAQVGNVPAEFKPVALTNVVRDVVHDLEAAIEERDGQVVFEELGMLNGDSLQLNQLFQTLLAMH